MMNVYEAVSKGMDAGALASCALLRSRATDDGFVILCHLPQNAVTPWVTWRCATSDGTGPRYNGHYFYDDEEADAVRDFETR